jgi:hypothetical protein
MPPISRGFRGRRDAAPPDRMPPGQYLTSDFRGRFDREAHFVDRVPGRPLVPAPEIRLVTSGSTCSRKS